MNIRSQLPLVLLLTAFAAACGDDATTTTPTPEVTSPTTSTLTSQVTVNGAVARTFPASKAGPLTVTLTSVTPANTRLGLGVGVPGGGIASCTLSTTMVVGASATPQFTANVDQGSYCVVVYDSGTLTDTATFDLTVVFP